MSGSQKLLDFFKLVRTETEKRIATPFDLRRGYQRVYVCDIIRSVAYKLEDTTPFPGPEYEAIAVTKLAANALWQTVAPRKRRVFADHSGGWWAQNKRGHAARLRALDKVIQGLEDNVLLEELAS